MAYSNDMFISYAHEDVAWIRKLEADLTHPKYPKLHIFRDETRLKAGDVWRTELLQNLEESQHLVVVWSDKAKQSGWVNAEIANFLAKVGKATDRKLLVLLLQGTNPAYDPIQMLQKLQGCDAYSKDPQQLPPPIQQIWQDEVDSLVQVIQVNDPRIPIPYTVAAMTEAEAATLTGTENIAGRAPYSLAEVLARLASLGLGTLPQLQARYATQRIAWKPFLGATTIENVLNQLLNQINTLPTLPAQVRFKWEWMDFLTGNMMSAKAAVGKLSGELAVVIVDPLSLYHPNIYPWIPLLAPCFERENVIITTLTPFELPSVQAVLRDLVRDALAPMFDFYYEPPVPLTRHPPLCGLNLCDNDDMRRIVQFRIGRHPHVGALQDVHPAIAVGGGSGI